MADDYDGFGGPYSNITPEYVDKYMSSKNVPEFWSDETAADYRKGYGAGWAGIPGDMLNALTAWAVSGIPDPLLREQARTSLHIPGTDDIGRSMDADVESAAFQTGAIGLPGLDDIFLKTPWLAMTLFHGTPHKFNKFDLSAIGTGEGAQAFGHGLYFAENPGVAGQYKDTLGGRNQDVVSSAIDRVVLSLIHI